MSIQHFHTRVLELKTTVQDILNTYTPTASFGECVALHTVNLVQHMLKPERLIELMACALDLQPSDFDLNLVKKSQLLQGRNDAAGRKPRAVPTEAEKDDTRKRKSEAVD